MFKDNLKKLRLEKNLTQVELSSCLNMSLGAVGNWESGKRTPDAQMLLTIADFFGVSVDSLLRNEADNPPEFSLSKKEKRLISAYRNQPDIQLAVDRLLEIDTPIQMPTVFETKLAASGGDKSAIKPNVSAEDLGGLLDQANKEE